MDLVRRLLCAVLLAQFSNGFAATRLVDHADVWFFHKGTNAPQANWAVIADAELNSEWSSGAGGFGYGDAGIVGQATLLSDMSGRYTSAYFRKSFRIDSPVAADSRLQLTIDYDDAYIVYLDGMEIGRSPNAPADPASHLSTATTRHEASCCDAPVNPASVIDLGFVGNSLGAGEHVLAIHGFNDDAASSDFHIIADLDLIEPGECAPNTICADTTWSAENGPYWIRTNLTVLPGATLSIEAGTAVRFEPNISIRASAGGTIDVRGTATAPVTFAIQQGTSVWGELAAEGAGSALTIRHADISGGAVNLRNGALGLIEDSYIHHFKSGSTPITGCNYAAAVTVRRSHFNTYHETLWRFTPMLIEDSLFENSDNPSSDALDFDGAPAGSTIRRCTFRNGPQSNTDAIDLGTNSRGVIVEDCLMINFPNDKGVSVGEDTFDVIIRNCVVYGCDSGVAVKDNCTATIYGCTFVNNDFGFRNYNKQDPTSPTGGGHIIESYNNILWGNGTTVSLQNGSTLAADHSLFGGLTWPGDGNIDIDPGFVNAPQNDFRLPRNSPALTAGRNGAMLGARSPVGAPMAASHPSFTWVESSGAEVNLRFWVDSARSYSLLAAGSAAATEWTLVRSYQPGGRPREVETTEAVTGEARYFILVSPAR